MLLLVMVLGMHADMQVSANEERALDMTFATDAQSAHSDRLILRQVRVSCKAAPPYRAQILHAQRVRSAGNQGDYIGTPALRAECDAVFSIHVFIVFFMSHAAVSVPVLVNTNKHACVCVPALDLEKTFLQNSMKSLQARGILTGAWRSTPIRYRLHTQNFGICQNAGAASPGVPRLSYTNWD